MMGNASMLAPMLVPATTEIDYTYENLDSWIDTIEDEDGNVLM